MNRKNVCEDKEVKTSKRNPFQNPIRGNIKNNSQIDSFLKSQEVYELLHNTLGSQKSPNLSKSIRIPLKHTTQRDTSNSYSNTRNRYYGWNSKNGRSSFDNQYKRKDNPMQRNRGNNSRSLSKNELFSRRERNNRNDPRTSTFSKDPRQHSQNDFYSRRSVESQDCKSSSLCERRDKESSETRNPFSSNRVSEEIQPTSATSFTRECSQNKSDGSQSREVLSLQREYANPHSNSGIQQDERPSSKERNFVNPFSNAPRVKRKRYSSRERFSSDKEVSSCFPNDRSVEGKSRLRDRRSREKEKDSHHADSLTGINSIYPKIVHENDKELEECYGEFLEAPVSEKEKVKCRQAIKKLKAGVKNFRLGKPCKVQIKDKSHPTGKILEDNAKLLTKSILRLLKDSLDREQKYPRFLGHSYENEMYTVMCADVFSGEFLRNNVRNLPPPWKDAKLEGRFVKHFERIVDVNLPKSISHLSEFCSLCEEGNSALNTKAWRLIAYEDSECNDRRLYTIGMDTETYDKIQNEFDGLVRCGDENIKFVLNLKKSNCR